MLRTVEKSALFISLMVILVNFLFRRINIKNGWEKKGNRGLAVFSYSIPSQLIISETLANLGHRESIKMMVLKTHENRRKSTKIAPYIMQDFVNKIGVHPYFYPLNSLNGYSFGKYAV